MQCKLTVLICTFTVSGKAHQGPHLKNCLHIKYWECSFWLNNTHAQFISRKTQDHANAPAYHMFFTCKHLCESETKCLFPICFNTGEIPVVSHWTATTALLCVTFLMPFLSQSGLAQSGHFKTDMKWTELIIPPLGPYLLKQWHSYHCSL